MAQHLDSVLEEMKCFLI